MRKIAKFSILPVAMLTLSAPAAAQAQAAPDGALLFRQRCASCHVAAPNATTRLAPDLTGVVGRKAATAPGFNFSPALKNANITWTRANLDQYLTAPSRMVPGTRMVIAVPNPAQRAAILDHLARPAR
ncbi:MAG TPA: c-type cytochrome [Novosphingobium sp.]|nr:c-type cytochrome [Novosphingobium sp.]HMP55913.1 c-type cytochrome [Novosphingobium sp.]